MGSTTWWGAFADAVLARAAFDRTRLGEAADVDRLLDALPTVTPPPEVADERAERQEPLDAHVEHWRSELRAGALNDPLTGLARRLGGGAVAVEVLALAVAIAASPARLRLVRWIAGDQQATGAALGDLAEWLDERDVWRATAADSALVRHGLLVIDDAEAGGASIVRAPGSLVSWLSGGSADDPALPAAATWLAGTERARAGRWAVHGPDRALRLAAVTEAAGTERRVVTTEPETAEEWSALIRAATLAGAAIVLEVDGGLSAVARRNLLRADRVGWFVVSKYPLPVHELPVGEIVEITTDDGVVDAETATEVLGERPSGMHLHHEQLDLLRRVAPTNGRRHLRRLAGGELDQLATRITPRRTWDDLVLAPDQLAKVREVADRVRYREQVHDDWGFRWSSPGVVALFTGPSGTGKTISAEVIAGDLGVDVFRLDVARVVSKYIGETEQRLERVFAAAETAGVVLLFDEADAIFGKRTAVEDATDRYANLETNYLLQRVENYRGVTVLTSNFAQNIDEAFLRRIHVSVDFPLPDPGQRLRIWQTCFPEGAPVGDLDLDLLAQRYKISGGSIRASAHTAAFTAAAEGSPIEMRHVFHGLRREHQKLGRLIRDEDFV